MTAFVLQIAGALLATLLLVILRFVHLSRRRTLAAVLFLAALIYVAFAVQQSATVGSLGVELLGLLGFGMFGWLGLRSSEFWLAAGWALHALWDVGLHLLGPARGIAPHWYVHLCLSFDLVVAGYVAVVALSGRRVFPHQLSWLLDNPLRRLLVSPDDIAARLALSETSRVLEVGPGSGYFSAAVTKRVPRGELTLLDLQPEMLAKARRKLESMGFHNIRYTSADVSADLPYPDGHFDAALLVSVLGEIPDQRACLRSLHRVLRVGGLLAVHESLPDPDMLKFEALVSLVQAESFTLARRWGPSWNYTATFERAKSDIEPLISACAPDAER